MSDLRELYQEVIIDHGRRPRNFGAPTHSDRHAEGFNPLCGDQLTVFLTLDGETVKEARFEGAGCAISMASASLMTESLRDKPIAEAEQLIKRFKSMVMSDQNESAGIAAELGKLGVLAGVRDYPARVKCATLAWHTLDAALQADTETGNSTVSTE